MKLCFVYGLHKLDSCLACERKKTKNGGGLNDGCTIGQPPLDISRKKISLAIMPHYSIACLSCYRALSSIVLCEMHWVLSVLYPAMCVCHGGAMAHVNHLVLPIGVFVQVFIRFVASASCQRVASQAVLLGRYGADDLGVYMQNRRLCSGNCLV